MRRVLYIFALILTISCGGGESKRGESAKGAASVIADSENIIEDANLLKIAVRDGYRVMEVVNVWDTTKLLNRYIFVPKGDKVPKNLPSGDIVRTPVDNIVAFTSVDIGSLSAIGSVDKVVGVCEAKYIQSPIVQKGLKSGDIKDLGSYVSPNVELLLASSADVIIASPYEGKNHGIVEELGITIADCASYLEKSPLGRSEWIKFYGEFCGEADKAQKIYNETRSRFNATVSMISSKITRTPKILPERRYGQVWFVAAGGTYSAKMYKAAGGAYPWAEDRSSTTIPLSFEEVYKKAHDADVWLFTYTKKDGDMTLSDLAKEHESYAKFKPFIDGNVYGCNSELVPIYEDSPLRPDLILLDIAKMLHPELFKEHNFVYYKRLERGN